MLAIASAAASAVAAGAAVVAQQRAAHDLGGADRRLLRSRWWLAGTGASVLAVALQAAALSNGPVGMVQALLAGAVAWAAIGEALLARRVPPPPVVLGIGLAVGGTGCLSVLLHSATTTDPGGPRSPITVGAPVVAVAVIVVLGMWWARRHPGAAGAPGLALACGAGYGLAAALLAVLARTLPADLGGALGDPRLILAAVTLVIVGPTAFALSQHALARARHAGAPMTLILLADPVVATATGAVWFRRARHAGPADPGRAPARCGRVDHRHGPARRLPGALGAHVIEERVIALVIWLAAIRGNVLSPRGPRRPAGRR